MFVSICRNCLAAIQAMFPLTTTRLISVGANGSRSCQTMDETEPARQLFREGAPRVLHLVDSLNIGGTENQMACVALRMRQIRHQVTVGCLRAEGPLLQLLQQAGVPVVEFRKERTLLSFNGARQL